MYGLIRNLTSPNKPSAKTYAELKELVTQYLEPKPLITAERFKFYLPNQRPSETTSQCTAELRRLSEHCDFGGFLDDALRDRFVSGLSSVAIQRKLLTESTLDIKKARDIAVSMEMADSEARTLKGDGFEEKSEQVHTFHASRDAKVRCGKTNHIADKCFYKNSRCHTCKETGHLHKKCPKSKEKHFGKNQSIGGAVG